MERGDHLVTPRIGYTHHGIFVGNDRVVHYSGFADGISKGVIEVTSLKAFCNGNKVTVRTYAIRKYSHEESVTRAYSRLGEDLYNLLINNCEHFATWCITGWHSSEQVIQHIKAASDIGDTIRANKAKKLPSQPPICDQHGPAGVKLLKTGIPVLAKPITPVATSAASGLASSALGVGSGIATGVGVSSVAGTAAMGIVGVAGGSVLATVAAPVAAGVAVGYGIKKLVDWIRD